MSKSSQQRVVTKGLVRFEVTGRDADRELVRTLARRLAEGGPDSDSLRAAVVRHVHASDPASSKGGILKALRASPLVGAELDLSREREDGREVLF